MSTKKHTAYEIDEPERMVVEEPVELFGGTPKAMSCYH
jgi:hypothetical protein